MRGTAARRTAAVLLALAAAGCFLLPGGAERPVADPAYGVTVHEGDAVAAFHARAAAFYERLTLRRVNTFGTYTDPELRAFFKSEEAFSDYYADLAQALTEARFEKNRPLYVEVREFVLDGPGRARVVVLLRGDDAAPLRYWSERDLVRQDRWERSDGAWWIIPGKL